MSTNVGEIDLSLILNSKEFESKLKDIVGQSNNASSKITSSLSRIGKAVIAAFSVGAIVKFGKECLNVATETSNAWIGLNSILTGQGKSFDKAKQFINEYISDGLVPLNNAVAAYKNLTLRGYNSEQIQKTMNALKNSATFARQSTYSLGDAVQTATEGLKNENSVVVDNAGVTKNVAKMWEDYAKSIGKTTNNLTQAEKIQAEVNGILEETKFQSNDAAIYASTYSGKLAQLNTAFTNLKTAVGNAIQPIAKLFIPIITSAVNAVTRLFTAISGLLALFGLKADSVETVSGGIGDLATQAEGASDAISGIGDSAKKAGKDAKKASNNLTAFDNLDVRKQDTSNTGGSRSGTSGIKLDTAGSAISQIDSELDALSSKVMQFIVPIQNAWNNFGQGLIDSIKNAGQEITNYFKAIEKSFAEVWTNGTGEKTLNSILKILTSVFNIIGNIHKAFKNAWESDNKGTQIIQSLWNGFNNLLEIVEGVHKAYEKWTASESFQIFANAITSICQTLSGWFEKITQKLKEIWDNGGKEAFTKLLEFISKLVEAVSVVLPVLEPIVSFLVNVVGDAINTVITVIGDVLEGLGGLLDFITGIFTGDWDKAWEGIKTFAESIWTSLLDLIGGIGQMIWDCIVGFLDGIKSSWDSMWQWLFDLASNIWNGLLNKIDEIFPGMKNTILNIVSSIANWIRDKFNFIKDTVSNIFNGVKNTVINIWNGIKNSISTAVNNIKNGITNAFQTAYNKVTSIFSRIGSFFSGIWNTVKNTFSKLGTSIGSAISNAVKSGINGVISMIQNTINKAINLINGAIGIINNIPGVNIGKLRTLTFPRLAEGGYVKANTPQLAMIGDNKHQGEVVAPEDKMLDMILTALKMFKEQDDSQRDTGARGETTIVFKFTGELAQLARILKPELDVEAKRKGFKLVVEGGTT